ncbi:MAG: hypothetical protein CMP91_12980 [Gammaproteobacteria bacterium]|nr:hypothetical protein [Gammaproteobacteria bacterium]|tara:strand:- start:50302 stop:51672 length:1371 start_codon:yes stop_codon:yes gene_type:complete
MIRKSIFGLSLLLTGSVYAQVSNNPFTTPIEAEDDIILVDYVEFAQLPEIRGEQARMMQLVDEPGSNRMFVNDMTGVIYSLSYDGERVIEYLNADDYGVQVSSGNREQGMQSFAFHPQFAESGTPGYGKFYTWTDSTNTRPEPDYAPSGEGDDHDLVLHEWTANNPLATTYDGGTPREMLRIQQPFRNHNGGQIGFNTLAEPGDADFGLLYVSNGDGGSGGDPMNMAQDLGSIFGKMLRIDPLGNNGPNGEYGIPSDNPFVGNNSALDEIYAYGIRNAQHFVWDADTGMMYLSEIGQNIVEEISPVPAGGNLGWNTWEASYRFENGVINMSNPRADASVTYPTVEWDHTDPILQNRGAASGLLIYRDNRVPQLQDTLLFADLVSGEILYVDANDMPSDYQSIRRVLFNDGGEGKTLLQLIQENEGASRADTRIDAGPDGRIFVLNKGDSIIREFVR